jgi:hypothetical protein
MIPQGQVPPQGILLPSVRQSGARFRDGLLGASRLDKMIFLLS